MAEFEFDDGKDDSALRTIGEVGAALGIKSHVLRYWEQQFPQLQPLKRSGGRRYYRPEDVELLRTIDRLVNREGYTLRGAQKALKDGANSAAGPTGEGQAAAAAAAASEMQAVADPSQAEASQDTSARDAVSADVLERLKAIRSSLARALAH